MAITTTQATGRSASHEVDLTKKPPPAPPPPPPDEPPLNPPPPPRPEDEGEFPMVPSADIMPPRSGIPESEKRPPPLPLAPPAPANADPSDVGTRSGTRWPTSSGWPP